MGEERKRAVVYTVDGNPDCIYQMEDSVKTVRRFFGDIDVIVLANEPDAPFDRKYGIRIVDVRNVVEEFGLAHTGVYWRGHECSPMLLMRLAIPLVPELREYDQVLYLDSDTEVWSREAYRLFEFDDEGHEVTAVRDELRDKKVKRRIERVDGAAPRPDEWDCPYYQRWDLLYSARAYVNSGVIVFNLVKFGTAEDYRKRFGFIIGQLKTRHPPYPDQDMLNIFYDIYLVLDRRYNSWCADPDYGFLRHNVGGVRRVTTFYPPENNTRPVMEINSVPEDPGMGVFSGKVDMAFAVTDAADPAGAGAFLGDLGDRYGLSNVKEVRLFESPLFTHFLKTDVPAEEGMTDADMRRFFGHYLAAKEAYAAGAEKALFADSSCVSWIEGDRMRHYMAELPVEYDCAVFDVEKRGELPDKAWVPINEEGVRIRAHSPSLYLMSRRCLKQYIWLFESLADPNTPFRTLRRPHKWLGNALRGKQRIFYINRNYTRKIIE